MNSGNLVLSNQRRKYQNFRPLAGLSSHFIIVFFFQFRTLIARQNIAILDSHYLLQFESDNNYKIRFYIGPGLLLDNYRAKEVQNCSSFYGISLMVYNCTLSVYIIHFVKRSSPLKH